MVITGHRSEKIADVRRVREAVRASLIEAQPDVVVCGMANGFDLYAGHEAVNLGFNVWCAKPWAGHKPRKGDEPLYNAITMFAEKIVDVDLSERYLGPWLYQKRNEWMVNQGTHILAYWDGSSGGTKNCLDYNRRTKKLRVRNLYERLYGEVI